MQRQSGGFVVGLIFGLLFTVIGYVVAFYVGKPILDKAQASVTWPSAPGTIVTSRVDRGRNSKGKTSYSVDVAYEYAVEGAKLQGNTVWFGGNYSSSNSSGAQKVVNRYPVGKQVPVYYNPQEPEVSVLETGAFFSSYIVYGLGLVFLVVGVLMTGGVVFKLMLGGLMIGTAVGSSLTSSDPASADPFASRPTFSSPEQYDPKDDGINVR